MAVVVDFMVVVEEYVAVVVGCVAALRFILPISF